MFRADNFSEHEPIVLTCRLVELPFDVAAYRAGDVCYCPYCGEPHRVPSNGSPQRVGSVDYSSSSLQRTSSQSRSLYAAVGVCGLIAGAFVGLGIGEVSHDRQASAIMLERLLEKASDEKQQAIAARTAPEAQFVAANTERQKLERERNELRRRLSDIEWGLEDAVSRLERLRK